MPIDDLFGSLSVEPSLQEILRDFIEAVGMSPVSSKIVLKGGMNLEVAMKKYNETFVARPTVDVDFHIRKISDWEEFLEEVPKSISNNSKMGNDYKVISRRGLHKTGFSDSVDIQASNYKSTFSVDVNIKDYSVVTEAYVDSYPLGYSVETMLADKVSVFLSEKIYRRSKDLYDLYILSYAKDYYMRKIIQDGKFKLDASVAYHIADNDKLSHAYSTLQRLIKKPPYEEVMERVTMFTYPIGEALKSADPDLSLVWLVERGEWG